MSDPNVWLEYEDDEGRKYYYNEASEETAWEAPEGAIIKNPDEVEEAAAEGEDQGQSDNYESQYDDEKPHDDSPEPGLDDNVSMEEQPDKTNNEPVPDDTNNEETMEEPVDASEDHEAQTEGGIDWIRYQDEEGRDYFYNSVTGVTQWDEPDKYMEPPEEEDTEQAYEQDTMDETPMDEQDATPTPEDDDQQPTSPSHEYADEPMNEPNSPQRSPSPEASPQEPEEPPKDPEQVALENADAFISKPDSVMETDVTSHFFKLFQSNGPAAATKLVASFTNQPAICGILSKWLIDMKQANESSGNSLVDKFDIQKLHTAHTHEVKNLMENIIAKTAKQNFTDEAQQTIFNLSKRERMFFEEMMEHERWRRLLIDLSAEHPDSALLTLLLQNISKRGYHREIAKRINQSDYFEVFHGMLSSELTLLAQLAINGGIDTNTAELESVDCADTIVNDLKRQSTTTDYTYIYAIELLDELTARSKVKAKSMSGPKALGLQRATRKWERIQEEITQHIVKPKDSDDGNPLTKKRKVDVAVMSSESNQKQRRAFRNDTSGQDQTAKIRHISHSFETGLLQALVYYARNSTVDSKLLDQLLYNPNLDNSREGKTKQGRLLLQHPLVLEYLLKSLFLRKNRSKSEDVKRKCSKLLAMAALAVERELNSDESPEELTEDDEKKMIDHFTNIIINGSKLCEKLDTIVTIVASDEVSGDTSNLSVGAQLSSSCMQSSIVAQGFLLWAKERISNSEFPNTAAYPGTAPGILSITRIIVNHHPLLRKPAIDIAFIFLHHSSSELGFQKMNAIKEQALRLLLIISTKGLATDIFVVFKTTLTSGSNIDSGLVRYFVAGCLDIMKPPISLGVVRSFGGMLLLPQCIEALKTNYFDTRKKQKLNAFLQYLEDAVASDSSQFTKSTNHDRSMSTSLKVAYAFS